VDILVETVSNSLWIRNKKSEDNLVTKTPLSTSNSKNLFLSTKIFFASTRLSTVRGFEAGQGS